MRGGNGKKRAGKLKGPWHWLCSSCQLLRGSQQRGDMHRHDPRCDHCFRSSKPRLTLAGQSVFSGLAAYRVTPACPSPSLLQVRHVLFWLTLSAIDASNPKRCAINCQCRNSVQFKNFRSRSMKVTTSWIANGFRIRGQFRASFAQSLPQIVP